MNDDKCELFCVKKENQTHKVSQMIVKMPYSFAILAYYNNKYYLPISKSIFEVYASSFIAAFFSLLFDLINE